METTPKTKDPKAQLADKFKELAIQLESTGTRKSEIKVEAAHNTAVSTATVSRYLNGEVSKYATGLVLLKEIEKSIRKRFTLHA